MDGLALLALIHSKALAAALLRSGIVRPEEMTEAITTATAEHVKDESLRAEICFALDEAARLH